MRLALAQINSVVGDLGGNRRAILGRLEEARAAGATIPRAGGATFYGGYSGIFVDPDGHPWEVAHNPHWTIADDGSVTI
jgi:uncharacterized glyoxalase superfamily protein PhnB